MKLNEGKYCKGFGDKRVYRRNHYCDQAFWDHCGYEIINRILITFNENDWKYLVGELNAFNNNERYTFMCCLLEYATQDSCVFVDILQIYFEQYLLLENEDADWIIQDLMYVEIIKNPSLELLNNLILKVDQLRNYSKTVWKEEQFQKAEDIIKKVIEKHYS